MLATTACDASSIQEIEQRDECNEKIRVEVETKCRIGNLRVVRKIDRVKSSKIVKVLELSVKRD